MKVRIRVGVGIRELEMEGDRPSPLPSAGGIIVVADPMTADMLPDDPSASPSLVALGPRPVAAGTPLNTPPSNFHLSPNP